MKAVKRRANPKTKAKQPAFMKAFKRRSILQTKAKQPALMKAVKEESVRKDRLKKPKTTTVTSDSDNSFKEDDEDDEVDDADQDADVDNKEEDDSDENPDKAKSMDDRDDGEDGKTDDEASEVDNDVYETVPWYRGGELVFFKQVARLIAIVDNHYPGLMFNRRQMNDTLQHAIHLSRTTNSTYSDVENRNYMD
jgi:hypothetical protein